MNRVAVTGLGVVSALGNTVPEFSKSLADETCGITPLSIDLPEHMEPIRISVAGSVRGLDMEAIFGPSQKTLLDRSTQLALIAAREAIEDSGLEMATVGDRTAAILGTGAGSALSMDDSYQRLYLERKRSAHPFTVPRIMMNSPVSHITMENGIKGPSFMVSSACASASHAIGTAFQLVRCGTVDAAVTGGVEACLNYGTLRAWEALRVTAAEACRPFSKNRMGMSLGEGAALIVLENFEHAKARGARIHAELVGSGASSDAANIILPVVEGPSSAMAACLADTGLQPDQIGYINAHGTGTAANDVIETQAIRAVFGAHASNLLVSSTKAMHGHALGAAAALEFLATVIALRDGRIPPTLHLSEADPECDLDYVPNHGRNVVAEYALSNSFAFGGHNSVVALRRHEQAH